MKSSKLILASFLAVALTTMANAAATIVHFTGSTAFRAETHQAIIRALGGAGTCTFAYFGASLNKASEAIFYNANPATNATVIVETSWSGSVAGLNTLIGATPITTYLLNTTYASLATAATGPTGTPPVFGGGFSIPAATFDPANPAPDVSMADNFAFESPTGTGGQLTSAQVALITENVVGIVPFVWVRNSGAPVSISFMTNQIGQALLSLGSLPLSFWTGVNTDTTPVYAVGRDVFSGSRVITFSETGFGILNVPDQNEPTIVGGVVTAIQDVGGTGYSSGGNVATALNGTGSDSFTQSGTSVAPGWLVGYVAVSDGSTVTGAPGTYLTYNGVTFSPGAVENGQYSFWGYEHLDYLKILAGVALTTATTVKTNLTTTDAADFGFGILIGNMNVNRSPDGAPIFHN